MARVLECFSGTGSVGAVFEEAGFHVDSIDNGSEWDTGDPWGRPNHFMDVRTFFRTHADRRWFFGWASVPCQKFSVSVIGRNWTTDHQPKSPKAVKAHRLLLETGDFLESHCEFFLIENPRGKMRRIVEQDRPHWQRWETSWCQYREGSMKPSDIFGRMPEGWQPRPVCAAGSGCHTEARRGSQTGTQGMLLKDKGRIPREFVLEVRRALPHVSLLREEPCCPIPRQATLAPLLQGAEVKSDA